MFRPPRLVAAAALAASLFLVAGRANAQGVPPRGPFVGLGVGVGTLTDTGSDIGRFDLSLHAQAGWSFGGSAAMLELGVHGLGDERPAAWNNNLAPPPHTPGPPTGPPPDDMVQVTAPNVLGTVSLLASLQLGVGRGMYVRPGVGFSRHAIPTFEQGSDGGLTPRLSHEIGPAASVAVGRVLGAQQRLPVAVEGFGLLSHGEDSSGSRWAFGLRVVPQVRF